MHRLRCVGRAAESGSPRPPERLATVTKMTLRQRRQVSRRVYLPGCPVYLDDLETAFGYLQMLGDGAVVYVADGEADRISDLDGVTRKQLQSLQLVAADGTSLQFRDGLSAELEWVQDLDEPDRTAAVNAIRGHWGALQWRLPDWLWVISVLIGIGAPFATASLLRNSAALICTVGVVLADLIALAVVHRRTTTRVSLDPRPPGSTFWFDNLRDLRQSVLTIVVSAVLGGLVGYLVGAS